MNARSGRATTISTSKLSAAGVVRVDGRYFAARHQIAVHRPVVTSTLVFEGDGRVQETSAGMTLVGTNTDNPAANFSSAPADPISSQVGSTLFELLRETTSFKKNGDRRSCGKIERMEPIMKRYSRDRFTRFLQGPPTTRTRA